MSRILIVDDDTFSLKVVSKRLQANGYDVETAQSGPECLELVAQSEFDLIIMDYVMPGMSGIEVVEIIRKDKNSFELPIIMLTSKNSSDNLVESLKRGANDYLTKPVNIDIAVARIKLHINLKELNTQNMQQKQAVTIATLITTLNHEINNPLAIALGHLNLGFERMTPERFEKVVKALYRIADLVKEVQNITTNSKQVTYSDDTTMYEIKKKVS